MRLMKPDSHTKIPSSQFTENSSLKYLMLILNTDLLLIKLVVVFITDDRDVIVQPWLSSALACSSRYGAGVGRIDLMQLTSSPHVTERETVGERKSGYYAAILSGKNDRGLQSLSTAEQFASSFLTSAGTPRMRKASTGPNAH